METTQILHNGEYLDKYNTLIWWNEYWATFKNVKQVFYFNIQMSL